ncbi:MAG: hypothetical protein V4723_07105 [Pseudomonadota bacterium]
MSEPVYLTSIIIFFGTIIAIFAIRYRSLNHQASARLANDEAYRKLAEKAILAESATAAALADLQSTLAEVRLRVSTIEKVLKEVE